MPGLWTLATTSELGRELAQLHARLAALQGAILKAPVATAPARELTPGIATWAEAAALLDDMHSGLLVLEHETGLPEHMPLARGTLEENLVRWSEWDRLTGQIRDVLVTLEEKTGVAVRDVPAHDKPARARRTRRKAAQTDA